MKRVLLTTLFAIALSLLVTGIAYAQDGSPQSSNSAAVDVAVLLAPLVAAATAVERIIEMIFDWYESMILNLSKFPARVSDYLGWARKEVEKFKNELIKPKGENEKEEEFLARVRAAEANLLKAQDRLNEYLSSPTYISTKKKISLVIGIVLGLIVAISAQIKMFTLLGIPVPENLGLVDMIITGLVIGTGSAPVHSLIGLIQNTKDAVDGARAMWDGRAIASIKNSVQLAQAPSPYPAALGAPMAGMEGAPSAAAVEQAVAETAMDEVEMDRMVRRVLRK
jgi:hypothetical protein